MKRYSKKVTKKKRIRLSPKNAENIIEKEFIDSKGNKIFTNINIKPHRPSIPTIQIEREYKEE